MSKILNKYENSIYVKNRRTTKNYIDTFFQPKPYDQVISLQKRLQRIIEFCIEESKLTFAKSDETVRAFGSSTRNTMLPDEMEFDFSANLSLDSSEKILTDVKIRKQFIESLSSHLRSNNFTYKRIENRGIFKHNSLYRISVLDLITKKNRIHSSKIDIIFNLFDFVNIGSVNQRVIDDFLHKFEKNQGQKAKLELLANIRFTKWLFKQERKRIDDFGRLQHQHIEEKICDKYGWVSVLIELAIIHLCKDEKTEIHFRTGSFDKLMNLLYDVDLEYRTKEGTHTFMPLDIALQNAKLLSLKRVEVQSELKRLSKHKRLPEHLKLLDIHIIHCFKSPNKWFLLMQLVRDYFENDQFPQKYLNKLVNP